MSKTNMPPKYSGHIQAKMTEVTERKWSTTSLSKKKKTDIMQERLMELIVSFLAATSLEGIVVRT